MSEYTLYRRIRGTEMRPYRPGEVWDDRIMVLPSDKENGSPKAGDMIARFYANSDDQWLIAADYFAANFEPME